jgi:hypothetical protein
MDEAVTTADAATLTTASYRPSANTEVIIEMVEARQFSGGDYRQADSVVINS